MLEELACQNDMAIFKVGSPGIHAGLFPIVFLFIVFYMQRFSDVRRICFILHLVRTLWCVYYCSSEIGYVFMFDDSLVWVVDDIK